MPYERYQVDIIELLRELSVNGNFKYLLSRLIISQNMLGHYQSKIKMQ